MIEEFFQKVLELKNVPRQGWKEKLEILSTQLESENEPSKQQELIKSLDSLVNVIAKLKTN